MDKEKDGPGAKAGRESKDLSGNDSTEHSAASTKAVYKTITWGG